MKKSNRLLSILLCCVMLIGLLPTAAFAWTAPTLSGNGGDAWNVQLSDEGVLTWNDMSSATYDIYVDETAMGVTVTKIQGISGTSYNLIDRFKELKIENGTYYFQIKANGPDTTSNTINFKYVSPQDKLPAPQNLTWDGTIAKWDSVSNATGYEVKLYSNSGYLQLSKTTTETQYDWDTNVYNDGFWFEVIATAAGYRDSNAAEGPKYVVVTHSIGVYAYDDTFDALEGGGQVYLTTDKGTDGWSSEGYIKEATAGTTVTLNVNPAPGYQFVEWRQGTGGSQISTDANYSFTASEDKYLYAVFETISSTSYNIELTIFDSTYKTTDGGTVSIQTNQGSSVAGTSAEKSATENTAVTITAVPEQGYAFVGWKKSSPYVQDTFSTEATYTFVATEEIVDTNEDPELFLYAVFQETQPQATTYLINCVAHNLSGGGTAGTVYLETDKGGTGYAASQQKYATENATVKVNARAEEDYEFVEWRKSSPTDANSVVSTEANYEFTATEDVWIYAVFQHTPTCTIDCSVFDITNGINNGQNGVGGTVSILTDIGSVSGATPLPVQVTRNSSVTVNAVAAQGYEFIGWKKSSPYVQEILSTSPTYTFTINEYLYLYAVFQEAANVPTYTVSFYPNYGDGTMNPVQVPSGEYTLPDCAFTMTGYDFDAWAIGYNDGPQKQPGDKITITGDTTLYAKWQRKSFAITAVSEDVNKGTVTGSGIYEYGELATLTATPKDGYVFDGWYKDGYRKSWQSTDSFLVSGDATYTAKFNTLVTAANAVIDAPVEGANPDMTPEASDPDKYTVTFYKWYWNNNGVYNELNGESVFVAGEKYELRVVFAEKEGYEFSDNVVFTVNNGTTEVFTDNDPYSVTKRKIQFEIPAAQQPTTYTVTVSANDAAYGSVSGGGTYDENASVTVTATPNSGYQFVEWTENGQQVSTDASYTFAATANRTLEAVFEAIPPQQPTNYTVSFNANGGSGTMADVTGMSGDYMLPSCALTAPAGKQFKCWAEDSVNGTQYYAGYGCVVDSDVTFYAIWEDIPVTYYTVTFDSAGGSAVTAQTIEEGQKATKPADPTKSGFDFKGWTLNGSAYDFNTAVNGNITLVATWEQQQVVPTVYTVTFDSNGGSAVTAQSIEAGQKATKPADPTKDGYDFKGWTLNGSAYDFNTAVNGNITLVATWEQQQVVPTTYTVSFAANGGTGTMADVTGISGEYTLPENGFTAPDGKQFKAWSVGGNEKAVGDKITVTANTTVTAVWENIPVTTYTVTFNANGGSVTPASAQTNADGKLASLPTPTRSGSYSFNGWYTAASGGTKVTASTVFNANTTIYAQWTYTGGGGGGGGYVSTYAITVEDAKNGDVTVSQKSASKGTTVTVTVDPDKGYTLETLSVTDKNGKEIELTNKGNGKYTFVMPASKVTVKATFMDDNTMLNFFVDVPADAYYYDAVLWAVKEGITNGTSATTFSPDDPCTRAQMATFLWRAAGSPEPVNKTCIFTDVPADAYYAKAVQWAYEQKITVGTSATTFSPDETCTRAQMATFLCRVADGEPVSDTVIFNDIKADKYYAKAVQWAVENGITNGTGDNKFSPDATCTRAQMVTFLYRYFVK